MLLTGLSVFLNLLFLAYFMLQRNQYTSFVSNPFDFVATTEIMRRDKFISTYVNPFTRSLRNHESEVSGNSAKTGRKLFIAFGAADGQSTEFFLEDKINGGVGPNKMFQGKFDGIHGMGSEGRWDVIVVEPNVAHKNRLEKVQKHYQDAKLVNSFTIHSGTVIGDHNGVVSFYFGHGKFNEQTNDGASIMKNSGAATFNNSVTLPMIDILDLFRDLKLSKNDIVVIKMDIEGAEFMVLRQMFVHGLLHFVNIIAIEWHVKLEKDDEGSSKREFDCVNWVMQKMPHLQLQPWI